MNPFFSPDGQWVGFGTLGKLNKISVEGDVFVAEKPPVWITKLGGTLVDVAPDGRRVAVLAPVVAADAPKQEHEVVILQNFFDELRRRVPVGH